MDPTRPTLPSRRQLLGALLALSCAGLPTLSVHAQPSDFPTRPIRLVVPFVNGGVTDTAARVVAEKLGERLGQSVIVENKPGAGGNIGTQMVARADPDGYTLLLAYDGTLVINPNVYAKVPFDTLKDFTSVGKIGDATLIIVVNPKVPAKDFATLKAYAQQQKDGLFYGTAGTGSTPHLAGELLRQQTGIPLTHVPYKGGSAALTDVVGGALPMTYAAVTGAAPFIKSNMLQPIAVSSAQRAPSLPNVPTLIEQGVKDFEFNSWVGLMAPAGTPAPVIAKLNDALQKVLRAPGMAEKLSDLGVVAMPGTPEAFGTEVARELSRIKGVVETAKIKLE